MEPDITDDIQVEEVEQQLSRLTCRGVNYSEVIDENDNPTVTKIQGAATNSDIHRGDWNHVHVIAKGN